MTMLSAALSYASAGGPVFPCRPAGKEPLIPSPHPRHSLARDTCRGECGRWGHGVHDATTDEATIRQWWSRWPSANVAIATGAPGPDVLDVDVKDGRIGLDLYERARQAGLLRGAHAVVRTPSGGLHLWFTGTAQRGGAIGPHRALELKAAGGYVLAPPSYVETDKYAGQYELVKGRDTVGVIDWLAVRQLLAPPPPRATARPGARSDLGALARWVAGIPEGNRNASLYWAACRAVENGHDNLDELVLAGTTAGLPMAEAVRTVESARRRLGSHR